jgi:soluble lytic murein transglycosylase-like protein
MIKTITVALLTTATFSIFSSVNDFHNALPTPVQFKEDARLTTAKQALFYLDKDPKYARPIYLSAIAGDIDPDFWAFVVNSESEFLMTARSNKGYKGFAQTPKAVMKTGYEVADLTYGACVFKEKMIVAKGNKKLALALYKGGNNPQAHKQAEEVFKNYNKYKEKMKG